MPSFDLSAIFKIAALAAQWVAMRLFITAIVTVTLATVLFNVWSEILQTVINMQNNLISDSGIVLTGIQVTGFSAWLFTNLKIPESMTIIMSAVATRFVLGFFRR